MSPTVGDVTRALDRRFPASHAEPWDRVGLVVGDASREVARVLVSLDADAMAVGEAERVGAELLVTHHPPFLEAPRDPYVTGGASSTVGIGGTSVAVASYHTNLDRSEVGSAALATALGLEPGPLLAGFAEEASLVTAFVPADDVETVLEAMWAAGAGTIGAYERCAFTGEGLGRFEAAGDARPHIGAAGEAGRASEQRVEVLCSRNAVPLVTRACMDAHPYDEPLILASEVTRASRRLGYGRLCTVDPSMEAIALAQRAAERLGGEPRVWGDGKTRCTTVAVVGGSSSSFVDAAVRAGAQALVCGEVRYHSALEAVAGGATVVELGHDVSEWPLVDVLFAEVARATEHTAVEVVRARPSRAWRTLRGSHDGTV